MWNKLYRRDAIGSTRFLDGLQYGEDGLFVMELLAKGLTIHHAKRERATVVKWLENKRSLSHVKTAADMVEQIHEYERFLMRQTDPAMIRFTCDELAKLWSHERVKKGLIAERGASE